MDFESLIEKLGTPVVSAAAGIFAGLLLASHDASIAENTFFLERQAKAADDAAHYFSNYIENWRRIIIIRNSIDDNQPDLSDEVKLRFANAVSGRDSARDGLFSALNAANLYFGTEVIQQSGQFQAWDEQQSSKRSQELPPITEWQQRGRAVFLAMREDLLQ